MSSAEVGTLTFRIRESSGTPQHSDIVTAIMANPGFPPFYWNVEQ